MVLVLAPRSTRLSRHIYTIPVRLSGAEQSRIRRWRSASLPTCGCPKELYEATSRVGSRIGSSNATSNCRRIFCPAVPELSGCGATFKKRQESDGSDRACAVSCSHPEQRVDETFHQPANSHLPGARIGASAFHTCPHSERPNARSWCAKSINSAHLNSRPDLDNSI